MGQLFHPSANVIARASLIGGVLSLAIGLWLLAIYLRSPYATDAREAIDQPVPFSHQHHVTGLGIECRYCHTLVERSSSAGMPPTETCMTCHSQIWSDAPLLEPVRASLRSGQPIRWNRVYDLPDFVYFNHSIHVNKGIGCESCHGRIDQMPLTAKAQPLQMAWCLGCHQAPGREVRPRDQIYTFGYRPAQPQGVLGPQLVREYHIRDPDYLTACSICHR